MSRSETRSSETKLFISVIYFTTSLVFMKYPQAIFPVFCILYLIYCDQRKNRKYIVEKISSKVLEGLVQNCSEDVIDKNVDTSIFVSHTTLQALCVNNDSWLKVKICSKSMSNDNKDTKEAKPEKDSFLSHVIGLQDMEQSAVLISDIFFHNLKHAELIKDCDDIYFMLEKIQLHISESCQKLESFSPTTATRASVCLVQTCFDPDVKLLDNVLKSYFSTPHYLSVGDMFVIDVLKYCPSVCYSLKDQNLTQFYFVVKEIEAPDYNKFVHGLQYGHYIKKGITTLLLANNVQRYLPSESMNIVKKVEYLTADNYKHHLCNRCPTGLEEYYKELAECLQTFILQEIDLSLKPIFLLQGLRGVGKGQIVTCASKALGLHLWNVDCLELQGNVPGYTEGKLKFIFERVQKLSPCILLLRNIEMLCKDKEGKEDCRVITAFHEELKKLYSRKNNEARESFPIFLVGTCHANPGKSVIPPSMERAFLHTISMSSPNEMQRRTLLQWFIRKNDLQLHNDVSVSQLASRSSGFLFADLTALVSRAIRNCYLRMKSLADLSSEEDYSNLEESEHLLMNEDFEKALETMQSAYADAIGAPKIPAVTWDDVGGLVDLKDEILRTINILISRPELAASGLRRSGLLLYGPPGTGKTLLAKAVATECSFNFLSVKGPELLNMYVGQSEENVREVFQRARSAEPCIIFFDELDSLAPNRGRSGDSGGVMDRVVSQLLAEMDGVQKSAQVFVIGATNRPDLIDPALLRPGRFDKLLYVGVCEDKDSQLSILKALTRKFNLKHDVSLSNIVSQLPSGLTGADFYSLCANAWLNTVRTRIHQLEEGADELDDELIEIGLSDFEAAISTLCPSVSSEDLRYFQKICNKIV